MNFIVTISLRNLLRQKKRNFLLGLSMACGVMILVVANSFSHGISDVLFNRVVRYVAGQVSISFYEKNMIWCQIFRDKERLQKILQVEDRGITRVEESVGIMARAIGNGKAENMMLVGIDTAQSVSDQEIKELEKSFKMVDGTFQDLQNPDIENPAILSTDKMKDLNVRKNDVIRVRFKNIFGQDQAARLTVVGTMKISNIFMSGVVFIELKDAKDLLGYRPWESGPLVVTTRDPKKDALRIADKYHKALQPGIAYIDAEITCKGKAARADVLGFFNKEEVKRTLAEQVKLTGGTAAEAWGKKGVLLTEPLARDLGAAPGEKIRLSYQAKFRKERVDREYTVNGVIDPGSHLRDRALLLNENLFYDTYYADLPEASAAAVARLPGKDDPVYETLATEWTLLPRTRSTDDFKKKMHQLTSKKMKSTIVDVATMYENASDILKLESALNLITLIAVLILFFIILIGVVNTLRMTIRERTREIGTMRAIGMQKADVRNAFILETFFLATFSSLVGVALAFMVMAGVSGLSFDMQDNPLGMFLVEGHVYFLPTVGGIIANVLLIVGIAVITAFFPARRAANLKAAEAFRHYE